MLVLSREIDQDIVIGNSIAIKVLDVRGSKLNGFKVRLGITCPSHIPVHRREVYEAILRELGADHLTIERPVELLKPTTESES